MREGIVDGDEGDLNSEAAGRRFVHQQEELATLREELHVLRGGHSNGLPSGSRMAELEQLANALRAQVQEYEHQLQSQGLVPNRKAGVPDEWLLEEIQHEGQVQIFGLFSAGLCLYSS